MRLRLGTAGYAYPAWVGRFYPPGTPADDHLTYYARHFPAVEINSSFYRPPTAAHIDRMVRRTPAGFGFTLKVPRSVSHDGRDDDLPAFAAAADRLADRLLGLILQVPEAFRDTPADRRRLAHVAHQLRPHRTAVEFRHRSWDTPTLPPWLADAGLDVVSVGVPDLPTLFPNGLRVVGDRVYARLHSRNPDAWYAGGKARYDYDYSDADLRTWAGGLQRAAAAGVTDALVFFNNCVGTQAVENARRLAALVGELAPGVTVVPPPAPDVRQPTLFDIE